MKRSKSGAQKRKEAATARDAVAKLPKMTDFFKITEHSRPGTSTERDEENYSVQQWFSNCGTRTTSGTRELF